MANAEQSSKDDDNTPYSYHILALVSVSYDFDGGMIGRCKCFFIITTYQHLQNDDSWYTLLFTLVYISSLVFFSIIYLPIRLITKVQNYKQINNKI